MHTSADDQLPARLMNLPSWLITQTSAHIGRLVSDGLATIGARGYHYRLLAALEEFGPASQAALSRRIGIHTSDVVAALNELAEQEMIERTPDPSDRRRNIIVITPGGRRHLRRMDKRLHELQDEVLAPLSAQDRDQLTRILTEVLRHQARRGGEESRDGW